MLSSKIVKKQKLVHLKTLLPVIMLSFALCFIFISVNTPALAEDTTTTQTNTYVALGDSIASGFGLPNTYSDPDLFVNKLAKKTDTQKINFAVVGITSAGLFTNMGKFSDAANAKIANASIITLSIGGNDILEPFMNTPLAVLQTDMTAGTKSFATNFPKIIANLKALNPNATLIVQTIYNPLDNISELSSMSPMVDKALGTMNALIKANAASDGYKVADVYTAFKSSNDAGGATLTNMASYDIHPNVTGHNIIFMANYLALQGTLPYSLTGTITNANFSLSNVQGLNLHIAVTAKSGYTLPQSVNVSIGGQSQTLALTNGQADIPASSITGDIIVTGMATKAPAAKSTATPTTSAILLNKTIVSLPAYNIGGNNYFKLRDLAQLLNGTDKQFEVGWYALDNAISITTAKAYTSVGGELANSKKLTTKTANLTGSKIYLDDQQISVTAYNIGGNNFLKLRDLASAVNFGVTWNSAANAIGIDTTTGYTAK